MKIGAQLYTVREFCQTTDAFAETLARVADLGYTTVQVSGTCAFEPEWLRDALKKNGLTCSLTHTPYARFLADPDGLIAAHKTFGCPYIGLGSMPGDYHESVEGVRRFAAEMRPIAQKIRIAGCLFMYHNHQREYAKAPDGRTYMEWLNALFLPREAGFTLDTYWVTYGGGDLLAEIRRLSGRIPCTHLQDMAVLPDGTRRYTWVGGGILPFPAILAAMETAGCEVAFVEQGNCFGEDPFDCLKKSRDYLKSLGMSF